MRGGRVPGLRLGPALEYGGEVHGGTGIGVSLGLVVGVDDARVVLSVWDCLREALFDSVHLLDPTVCNPTWDAAGSYAATAGNA